MPPDRALSSWPRLASLLSLAWACGSRGDADMAGCFWRQTGGCDPNGPREVELDHPCDDIVPNGMSGYCECIGADGTSIYAMEVECDHAAFSCRHECLTALARLKPAQRTLRSPTPTPPSSSPPSPPSPSPPIASSSVTCHADGSCAGIDPSVRAATQEYRCAGWEQTSSCDPDGLRDPLHDRSCSDEVPTGSSGYCLCLGAEDGTQLRVRASSCDHVPLTCDVECARVASHYACQGWRQTANCTADGAREESRDLPCDVVVPAGVSGYCECGSGVGTRKVPRPAGCNAADDEAATCTEVCMRDENLFEVLGLAEGAGEQALRQAFRRLSLRLHPDKNGPAGSAAAAAAATRFAEVRFAYDLLSSAASRALYLQQGYDLAREASKKPRTSDAEVEIKLTLEEAYAGGERTMSAQRLVVCKGCNREHTGTPRRCRRCGACPNELQNVNVQFAPGFVIQQQREVQSSERCEKGVFELRATWAAGVADGHVVVYPHLSEQRPGMLAGDIKLKFAVAPHNVYRRSGIDLHLSHTISLREALLGFSHDVAHLDGRLVTIAASRVTRPDEVLILAGEGMPHVARDDDDDDGPAGRPRSLGRLHVRITVDFPAQLTEEASEWARTALP